MPMSTGALYCIYGTSALRLHEEVHRGGEAPRRRRPVPRSPRARASVVLDLDRLALALCAASDRLALPLARAAAAFAAFEGWRTLGDARLEDYARETLGRSGRWLRDHARLAAAIARVPRLGDALVGADGGVPLGAGKTRLLARLHLDDGAAWDAWIARARALTLVALRAAVRDALAREGGAGPASADDLEPRVRVVLDVPQPVSAAFEIVCELARATAGRELSMAGVVEALLAEWESGAPLARDVHGVRSEEGFAPRRRRRPPSSVSLPDAEPVDGSEVAFRARITLAEYRVLEATAGAGDARALHDQLTRLVALEDTLLRRLGEVVAELDAHGAWATLPYAGIGDYAERRLGLGGTTVEDRVRAARALVRRPLLRAAYDAGRVSLEAALLAARALGRGAVDLEIERAWARLSREATVKRMRDELRIVRTRAGGAAALPATDAEWAAARRRDPGVARHAVLTAGLLAVEAPGADVFLRLTLPEPLAKRLRAAIEDARCGLTELAASVSLDAPWPHEVSMPSVLAARTFSTRARRVPAWAGLLALLEHAALTWDDPRAVPRRPGDEVYRRAGFRCEAPGCTSRENLHDHHLRFRAHGGGDELANRVTLCAAHHRMLHEGGPLGARGEAPLGVEWTKGGVAYRCERRARP